MEIETKRQKAIQLLIKQGQLPTSENIAEILGKYDVPTMPTTGPIKKPGVEVLKSYEYNPSKVTVRDFSNFFKIRYQNLKNLLFNRTEARDAVSIHHAKNRTEKGKVTIIAMITDIQKLSTGTVKLVLEDLSGKITGIISKKHTEVIEESSFISLDEVLAISGSCVKDVFFVDSFVYPEIPSKPVNYSKDEAYVAFTSDLHVGSNVFLPKKLQKFINWLNGKEGNAKLREMAAKTKYVFVLGDIVDGVGIYPNQNTELDVEDIYDQYRLAYEILSQIPEDKQIIMCGGNHDAMRIAEPQPVLSKKYAADLWQMKNITMVSNPAIVRVHGIDDYIGLKVLMYHGYSFTYFLDKIEGLRLAGGFDRPDYVIKYLLKRRHLAPAYGATLALPMKIDPLMIHEVPDVLATGHLHKAALSKYRNTIMISGSCWQDTTSFLEKVGMHPDPAKELYSRTY